MKIAIFLKNMPYSNTCAILYSNWLNLFVYTNLSQTLDNLESQKFKLNIKKYFNKIPAKERLKRNGLKKNSEKLKHCLQGENGWTERKKCPANINMGRKKKQIPPIFQY